MIRANDCVQLGSEPLLISVQEVVKSSDGIILVATKRWEPFNVWA